MNGCITKRTMKLQKHMETLLPLLLHSHSSVHHRTIFPYHKSYTPREQANTHSHVCVTVRVCVYVYVLSPIYCGRQG